MADRLGRESHSANEQASQSKIIEHTGRGTRVATVEDNLLLPSIKCIIGCKSKTHREVYANR